MNGATLQEMQYYLKDLKMTDDVPGARQWVVSLVVMAKYRKPEPGK